MRVTTIAIALSLLLLPAAQPAFACGAGATAQAATDLSAAKKKPAKKAAKKKKAKEKVEYLRAVPAK